MKIEAYQSLNVSLVEGQLLNLLGAGKSVCLLLFANIRDHAHRLELRIEVQINGQRDKKSVILFHDMIV